MEILLFDDGSEEPSRIANRKWREHPLVEYREMGRNIGRAAIRNKLAQEAKGEYCLFLDNDSELVKPDFLETYWRYHQAAPVICGGRVYPASPPAENQVLHWLYGSRREVRNLTERRRKPAHGFQSNNFMIRRSLFQQIGFAEALSGYGHEDTLFGMELHRRKLEVLHIDNPVKHGSLESNADFLSKTKEGLTNLLLIEEKFQPQPGFFPLLEKSRRLAFVPGALRKPLAGKICASLEKILVKNPGLSAFDAFRLFYLLKEMA